MAVVDYHSLSRRELQNLCKKHGIAANKTNAYMADALTSLLKVNQQNVFGSATSTALSEDAGSESVPSTMKKQNKRGGSATSEIPQGNTFSFFETGSKRTQPMEENATPSIMDTFTEEPGEENSEELAVESTEELAEENTKTGKETIDDTTKTSEAKTTLQHAALSVIDDRKELCHNAHHQNEICSKNTTALLEDAGIKSVPSKMEKKNERGDAMASGVLEERDPMEEDNIYNENVSKETTHAEKSKCNKTLLEQQFLQQAPSHFLHNKEGQHQKDNAIDRKRDDESLLCIHSSSPVTANVRDNHGAKIYTVYEKMIHLEGVEQLDQAKVVSRKGDENSLPCTSSSSRKEANDNEAKMHTGDKQTPIHMRSVNHLCQEEYPQQDKFITIDANTYEDKICTGYEEMPMHVKGVDHLFQNKEIYTKDQEETTTDPALFVSHERLEKQFNNDAKKKSQNHVDIDDRNGLLAKEVLKHDGACNRPPFCSGDEVEKVKTHTAEISDRSFFTSFQFFVDCENGIKLFVDLNNSSPSEWIKTHTYEFSLPQHLHKNKPCEHYQLKPAKCPTICEDDAKLEDKKTGSDKLADFQPWTSDFERSSNQNPPTCSPNFLKSQNFSSTSPTVSSRERRRISSVLIPPHGSNRGLAPFMIQKSSRFTSTFISTQNANNVSSSSSAIGSSHKSVSTQVDQINCLPECTQPIMIVPSKAVNSFFKQRTSPEKEMLLTKNQPDSKTNYSIDGPASPHASVESVSVITPIKDRCQDVEMLDQGLHSSSMETSKNEAEKEQGFHLAEEDFQNSEKEVESVSEMHFPLKSQKEMQHKSLLQDLQDEENRITSRYKNDYKKSPFSKNLRGMKNLARASTMRADILAKRRALPLVENIYACSQSSSVIHNLPYQSQNVQEKRTLHASLKVETGNENVASPQVSCATDLCASAKCSEREYSVIFPGVHKERDLSVSGLTPRKHPLQNVCNISTPLALQSSTKISESIPMLSKRENLAISPLVHQERHLSVSGLIPGKDSLQKNCNTSAPLALMGPVMTSVLTGIGRDETRQNTRISESNPMLSGWPFQAFTKKRFFEKALEESTERMHAQKMDCNGVNDCLSTQNKFVEKVTSNSVDSGHENQNRNKTNDLLDLNLINSSILETENYLNERVTERQKRHQEQFKIPLKGKSKEKAMEVAKKTAFVKRTEILNSKRGITSTK